MKEERTGQPWSVEEEEKLYDAFLDGASVPKMARAHGRSHGAVASHLKLLGLLDENYMKIAPVPAFVPTASALKRSRKQQEDQAKKDKRALHRKQEEKAAPIEINPYFEQALESMEGESPCLFITGKAGTGKSTLLAHFCRTTTKEPVVLAPTGVAALNVKGQTIHSFFNFYVDVTPQSIRDKKTKPRNAKLYKKLKTIVIDEISMVRADLLDCIDVFLRLYGPDPTRAFGGVQMIFIGDLYQLPPVVSSAEKTLFETVYKTPYFFSAQAMAQIDFSFIELEKVYRQKDESFVALLNKIRNNSAGETDLKLLNQRVGASLSEKEETVLAISLTTTNKKADEINQTHLEALKGKTYGSQADVGGKFTKEYYPTAADLTFKIGAQVMMLNNDAMKRWVNGSIGVIKAVREDEEGTEYVEVLLEGDDFTVEVYRHTWEVYRFGIEDDEIVSEPVGQFTQYPFRLAWAVTIHKSQGKTFDHVTIDIDRGTFAAGQIYVALSRCTSLEGICLVKPIARHHIRTDYCIYDFLAGLKGEDADDGDCIAILREAIRHQRDIEIVYLKGDDLQTKRLIRPLFVGEHDYKGKKFLGLRAHCHIRGEERTFSVDRILQIKKAT